MRRVKSIPLIPTFSLKGEGALSCVDTYAQEERGLMLLYFRDLLYIL
jgi:hypothetical protein